MDYLKKCKKNCPLCNKSNVTSSIDVILKNQIMNFNVNCVNTRTGNQAGDVNTVQSMLQKMGLEISDLACGAQYPSHKSSSETFVKLGTKPSAVHNNCSGKHAGMLALCLLLNHPIKNYLS
jgi:L-asparaginase II